MNGRPFAQRLLRLVGLILVVISCTGSTATGWAQDNGPPTADRTQLALSVGIQGRYRVGRWTAVKVQPSVLPTADAAPWVLRTVDGDGVDVDYTQRHRSSPPGEPTSSKAAGAWGYVVPGTEAAPLSLIVGEETVAKVRFPELGSPVREASLVDRDIPWVVSIGDPLGMQTVGANELLGRDARIAVSAIGTAEELPDRAIGYSGVDLLVINASGIPVLSAMSDQQGQALVDWIRAGRGRALVCLGAKSHELLKAAPWILGWLPFEEPEIPLVTLEPVALEIFTQNQAPLRRFRGARLPRRTGQPLIVGRTDRRVTAPIAVRYRAGLGSVTVVAADLDDEMFASWPQRFELMTGLVPDVARSDDTSDQPRQRATGFEDLAGHARATLDQFSLASRHGFSVISLILLGFILLIGPLDYLLINRVLGRPLLGWVTLPIMVAAISFVLYRQAEPGQIATPTGGAVTASGVGSQTSGTDPVAMHVLEMSDIDITSGLARIFSWGTVYSHLGGRFDYFVRPSDDLGRAMDDDPKLRTYPFGYAGPEFGGIQIQADRGFPSYDVVFDRTGGALRTDVHAFPLSPRSSKSFASAADLATNLPKDLHVAKRRGSEVLRGPLTNPLPVDLLDGMLVYGNVAYRLPTRFRSGSQVDELERLRTENFRWYLTSRKSIESGGDARPWDPTDLSSPKRIAEMLMFHEVVGGRRYTGLDHGPLGHWDLGELLKEGRCILFGRLASPFLETQLRRVHSSAGETTESSSMRLADEQCTALVRVIIPVVSP